MQELAKCGDVGRSAARVGLSANTGRKYRVAGTLPSDLKKPRYWRTRKDPFAADWPWIEEQLRLSPELESKILFEHLLRTHGERYQESHLRTLQRHVRQWRAEAGPPKEIFFTQEHRPGEAMQTDWVVGNDLEVTIQRQAFPHSLCRCVLPYSNWESPTVCHSESFASLRRGVQTAVVALGQAPEFHQTDSTSAATHADGHGQRAFNTDYMSLMVHYEMTPRTIHLGEPHENGDVEASNGVLIRRIRQELMFRGSHDFESIEKYESWVQEIATKANGARQQRLAEELAVMRPITTSRLPEFTVVDVIVTRCSTIRIKKKVYSVPARLIGESVRVRIHDDRLDVYYAQKLQCSLLRLVGNASHRVDYRHVIWSLVRKPGAFARYKYREDLFPTPNFRRAYDRLRESIPTERSADLEYLRILHLAASTSEILVEQAIENLLAAGTLPSVDLIRQQVAPPEYKVPLLTIPNVQLSQFDQLLEGVAS